MYYGRKGDSTTEAEVGECVRGMSFLTVANTKHLIKLRGLGITYPRLDPGDGGVSAAVLMDQVLMKRDVAAQLEFEVKNTPPATAADFNAGVRLSQVLQRWTRDEIRAHPEALNEANRVLDSVIGELTRLKQRAVAPQVPAYDTSSTDYAAEAAAYIADSLKLPQVYGPPAPAAWAKPGTDASYGGFVAPQAPAEAAADSGITSAGKKSWWQKTAEAVQDLISPASTAPASPAAPKGGKDVSIGESILPQGVTADMYKAEAAVQADLLKKQSGTPWSAADSAAVGSAAASTAVILSNLFKKKKKKKKKAKAAPTMFQPQQSSISPMLKALMIGGAIAGAGYLVYRAKGGSTPRVFRRAAIRTRRYARRARRYARKSYIGARRSVRKYTRRRR